MFPFYLYQLPFSVSTLFHLLTIIRRLAEFISCPRFKCFFFYLELANIWFISLIPLALHCFRLLFARFLQKTQIVLLTFDFEKFILCLFCLHLLLVYYSVQLNHTHSDFSHWLKFLISETRISSHLRGHYFFYAYFSLDIQRV